MENSHIDLEKKDTYSNSIENDLISSGFNEDSKIEQNIEDINEDDSPSYTINYRTFEVDKEHFRRLGFYCAFENKDVDLLTSKHKKKINEKIIQQEAIYNLRYQRLKRRIKELKDTIAKFNNDLINHKSNTIKLNEEKSKLTRNIEKIEDSIEDIHRNLASDKEKFVEKRIEQAHKEIDLLVSSYKKTSESKYEINKKDFENNKNALEVKVKHFEDIQKQHRENYKSISKQILSLNNSGIGPTTHTFLYFIGCLAAWASGWFLSAYFLKTGTGSKGTDFFLIEGIHSFIKNIFPSQGPALTKTNFLTTILFIIVTLAIITLISWLASRLIKIVRGNTNVLISSNKKSNSNDYFVFSYESEAAKIDRNAFLIFWLKNLAPIFILCLFTISLAFGVSTDQIKDLDTALSGQLVGTLIAFTLSGIIYLYVNKVIEPRPQKENITSKELFKNNFEIPLILALSILGLLSTFFVKSPYYTDIFLLFEFFTISILAGFCIAYGLRYRGLIQTSQVLERKISLLADAIRDNKRPKQSSIANEENKQFKQNYLKLQQQLYELVKMKNALSSGLNMTAKEKKKIKSFNILFQKNQNNNNFLKKTFDQLKNILNKKEDDLETDIEVTLSEIDAQYYPHYQTQLESISIKYKNKKKRLNELIKKTESINQQSCEYSNTLKNEIEKAKAKIQNIENELIKCRDQYYFYKNALIRLKEKQEIEIKSGYHLGILYKNQNTSRINELL